MQNEELPPPIWVARPADLRRMVAELSSEPLLAVDTESNSLYAYQEQVCLIQISSPTTDYLVDPLAISDLSPLEPLFSNPATETIFHAAEYDLICLTRDFAYQFSSLFDTMLAARILGRKSFGLGSLLESEFGLLLDKHYQRANWGQRPLKPAMLAYARLDSHYLPALRERLAGELEKAGRSELAYEDFRRMCATPVPPENGHDMVWRVAAGHDLSSRHLAVLNELIAYRDRVAKQKDLPAFKVLSNQALAYTARALPRGPEDLRNIPDLSPRLVERHAQGLLQAVERGLTAEPPVRPHALRWSDPVLSRLDRLKTWRKDMGQHYGVESDVILPRDLMEAIAARGPKNRAELEEVMRAAPVRHKLYGEKILRLLTYQD